MQDRADRVPVPSLSSGALSDTLSHDGEHLKTHDWDSCTMGDRVEPSVWGRSFVCLVLDHFGRRGGWAEGGGRVGMEKPPLCVPSSVRLAMSHGCM